MREAWEADWLGHNLPLKIDFFSLLLVLTQKIVFVNGKTLKKIHFLLFLLLFLYLPFLTPHFRTTSQLVFFAFPFHFQNEFLFFSLYVRGFKYGIVQILLLNQTDSYALRKPLLLLTAENQINFPLRTFLFLSRQGHFTISFVLGFLISVFQMTIWGFFFLKHFLITEQTDLPACLLCERACRSKQSTSFSLHSHRERLPCSNHPRTFGWGKRPVKH